MLCIPSVLCWYGNQLKINTDITRCSFISFDDDDDETGVIDVLALQHMWQSNEQQQQQQ